MSNFRIDCCQRLPIACCNSIRCMLCVASLSHVLSTAVRRTYVVLSVQLLRSAGVEGAALEQETDDDWSLAFEDVLILYADSLKSPAKGKPRDPFRTLVEEVFTQLDTVRCCTRSTGSGYCGVRCRRFSWGQCMRAVLGVGFR